MIWTNIIQIGLQVVLGITHILKKIRDMFEGFIRKARTDRYNIMCAIDENEKNYPSEHDDGSSGGGYPLPSNSTT